MRIHRIVQAAPLPRKDLEEMLFTEITAKRESRVLAILDALARLDFEKKSKTARSVAALLLLTIFIAPVGAKANPTVQEDMRASLSSVIKDEQKCRTGSTRAIMYASQIVDSFATATAVRHGAIARSTPYGVQSSPVTYLISQAVFDVVLGSIERKSSCFVKNTSNMVIGISAYNNALNDGAK